MIPVDQKLLLPGSEANEHLFWNASYRKRWTFSLFIQTTLLFAARVAMPVCATSISKQFGWDKASLGAVMGSFFWGYVTTQVIGGSMADKIGGDQVLWMSGFTWGVLTILTPFIAYLNSNIVYSVVVLALVRVFLGIAQGVHYPSMMSLLGKKIEKSERSLPSSIVTSASNFGTLVCGGVGSIIMENYGWERVFYVVGVVTLLCTYKLWTLSQEQSRKILSIDKMVFSQSSANINSQPGAIPWRKIFTHEAVWAMNFAHFCNNNGFYVLLSWLPTYFHENFPDEKGWVYNVVPWIFSIPACVLGGYISNCLLKRGYGVTNTRKIVEVMSLTGVAFFGMILPYSSSFTGALMCAGLSIASQTFHNSAVLVVPQDIAPSYAGSVFGVMNAIGAIPGFLGVYVSGYILSVTGSWKSVFVLMGFVNVIGALVFSIWGTSEKIL